MNKTLAWKVCSPATILYFFLSLLSLVVSPHHCALFLFWFGFLAWFSCWTSWCARQWKHIRSALSSCWSSIQPKTHCLFPWTSCSVWQYFLSVFFPLCLLSLSVSRLCLWCMCIWIVSVSYRLVPPVCRLMSAFLAVGNEECHGNVGWIVSLGYLCFTNWFAFVLVCKRLTGWRLVFFCLRAPD